MAGSSLNYDKLIWFFDVCNAIYFYIAHAPFIKFNIAVVYANIQFYAI